MLLLICWSQLHFKAGAVGPEVGLAVDNLSAFKKNDPFILNVNVVNMLYKRSLIIALIKKAFAESEVIIDLIDYMIENIIEELLHLSFIFSNDELDLPHLPRNDLI